MSDLNPDIEVLALQLYTFLSDSQANPWVQKLPSSYVESVNRAVCGLHRHKLTAFAQSMVKSKATGHFLYPPAWENAPETIRQLLDYVSDLVRCSVLGEPVRWTPAELSKILEDDSGLAMVCSDVFLSLEVA